MTRLQTSASNMSDSSHNKTRIGFSTGALEKGNYTKALDWMDQKGIRNVELSALRYDELEPLILNLSKLDLSYFNYISFHAPSAFPRECEGRVIELLRVAYAKDWNIVVHPDVIYTPCLWREFGETLLIENMDRRKHTGRSVSELNAIFSSLGNARLCLDFAHARQLDTTLTLLASLIRNFAERIAEVHISELDSSCRHHPMSNSAVSDYRSFVGKLHDDIPVIIESTLTDERASLRMEELDLADAATDSHPRDEQFELAG